MFHWLITTLLASFVGYPKPSFTAKAVRHEEFLVDVRAKALVQSWRQFGSWNAASAVFGGLQESFTHRLALQGVLEIAAQA